MAVEDYESDSDSESDSSDSDLDWKGEQEDESDDEKDVEDGDDPIFNPVLTAYDKLYKGFMQEVAHLST